MARGLNSPPANRSAELKGIAGLMDLNRIASQVAASAPAPDDQAHLSSLSKPANPADSRESFSSVLRSTRQDNKKCDPSIKKDEPASTAATDADTRDAHAKPATHQSRDSHDAQDRSSESASDVKEDAQPTGSADATEAEAKQDVTGSDPLQGMAAALLQIPTLTPAQHVAAAQSLAAESAVVSNGTLTTRQDQEQPSDLMLPVVTAPPSMNPPIMTAVSPAPLAPAAAEVVTAQTAPTTRPQGTGNDAAASVLDASQIEEIVQEKQPDQNESDRPKAAPEAAVKQALSQPIPGLNPEPAEPHDPGRPEQE